MNNLKNIGILFFKGYYCVVIFLEIMTLGIKGLIGKIKIKLMENRKTKIVNYILKVQKILGVEDEKSALAKADFFLENEESLLEQDHNETSFAYRLSLIH